jgi:UTP--glucose-1-phosphate uridylyltransferase
MANVFAIALRSAARFGAVLLIVHFVPTLSVGDEFEWAGIFQTSGNTYTWLAQKVNGAYADASMKMAAIPATSSTIQGLYSYMSSGNSALATTCVDVSSGGTITPQANKCYRLVFDQSSTQSSYTIAATGVSNVAFFCEHYPTEFENTDHYLKDGSSQDVEPGAYLPSKISNEYEWAGIFKTPGTTYKWLAQKVSGAYADASMKMVALPASSWTSTVLSSLESSGNSALATTCVDVNSGGTITPQANKCYRLVFDQSSAESSYTIAATGISNVAFFCEHYPTEFENTDHYLKDASNQDVEPEAYLPGYEWAGVFAVPENTYMWTAQKAAAGNTYADAAMKIAVLPLSSGSASALQSVNAQGRSAVQYTNCPNLNVADVITPQVNRCYNMVFKQNWWQSLYTIDATGHSYVAIFAQHVPTEFEKTAHYLKDDHGEDVEPLAQLPDSSAASAGAGAGAGAIAGAVAEDKSYWGEGILVAILVNIVTLAGVVFLVPGISKMAKEYREEFECVVAAFAAGAISACAFFLLLYEATHLIATEHEEEVDQIWRWGVMILLGALFPAIVHAAMELIMKPGAAKSDDPAANEAALLAITRPRLISSVLIGDFMHNMCDGFFIGAAFKGCGSKFAWGVAWGTIGHEVAQELGDYLVLTGKECNIHPAVALLLNFLSGTGVLWGTIIVLATEVSDRDIGLILAFGGGVYLNIAFIECMSKFQSAKVSGKVRALGILLFIIGSTAIGLVLLDHEHCYPAPPAPPAVPGQAPAPPPAGGHHHR